MSHHHRYLQPRVLFIANTGAPPKVYITDGLAAEFLMAEAAPPADVLPADRSNATRLGIAPIVVSHALMEALIECDPSQDEHWSAATLLAGRAQAIGLLFGDGYVADRVKFAALARDCEAHAAEVGRFLGATATPPAGTEGGSPEGPAPQAVEAATGAVVTDQATAVVVPAEPALVPTPEPEPEPVPEPEPEATVAPPALEPEPAAAT